MESIVLVVWAAAYSLVNSAADEILKWFPSALWVPTAALVGYDGLLLLWIFRTGRQQSSGLVRLRPLSAKEIFDLLPLGVFPLYNLVTGEQGVVTGAFLLQMLCAALTEELFFRGFLLSFLKKQGTLFSIFLTSILFAAMHSVNLLEGADGAYVGMQMLCAWLVSLCYCAVTLRFDSLLPCIGAHFLTNITGTGVLVGEFAMHALWVCIVLHILWGTKLCMDIVKKKEET